MLFIASGSRCRKWINLWTIQHMLKSCRSLSFNTPNSQYKLFTAVCMFLNGRVLKILLCVTINSCMNFFVAFT